MLEHGRPSPHRRTRSPRYRLVTVACSIVAAFVATAPTAAQAAPTARVGASPVAPPVARPQGVAPADHPTPGTGGPSEAPSPDAALPTGAWQSLGPAAIGPTALQNGLFYGGNNSGRVTALVTIPSGAHSGRMVLGSASGGIWTSSDGITWTVRTDDQSNLAIGSLAVDPGNAEHLIAGTGEANQCGDCFYGNGILDSTNGGDSWTRQNPANIFDGRHIAQVAIDATNRLIEYAATDGGLYVTTNGGTTWAKPTGTGYASIDGNITGLATDATGNLYVASANGAWAIAKSTDHGVTFARSDTGFVRQAGAPFIALALAASTPSTLYATSGGTGTNSVYKTTSSGTNWTLTAAPDFMGQAYAYGSGTASQGWYDNTIVVDPTNANHVIGGGITGVESADGGATWTNLNGKTFFAAGTNKFHPDFHALTFRPNGTVLLGTDGGP
jgi:hypothetical protein